MFSELDTGIRIFSVSSGSVSLASFCFRLSLEERFHKMPAHGHKQVQQWAGCVLVSRLCIKTGLLNLHVYLLAVTQYNK